MQVTFGKHKGNSVGTLVLKEPDYILWVLGQSQAEGALAAVKAEANRLIAYFDAKPFKHKCEGHNCQALATKFTVYWGSTSSLYFWCDSCDPYQSGALKGKLTELHTYEKALRHVEHSCGGTKAGYKAIIRELAHAKGLPQRSGKNQVEAFFA